MTVSTYQCPATVWNQCMERGCTESRLGCYGNAIELFNQALGFALYEFDSVARSSLDDAVARVLIVRFNLAECYQALSLTDRAAGEHIQVLDFLDRVTDKAVGHPDAHQVIMHALGHANTLWADFIRQYRYCISSQSLGEYHSKIKALLARESSMVVCH